MKNLFECNELNIDLSKISNEENKHLIPLLFVKDEKENVSTTVLFKYMLANFAKDEFKNTIEKLDKDYKYMRIREEIIVDPGSIPKFV